MAESTTIQPEGVVTSEAPQSRISPSEVAQPYAELANSLDKVGEAAETAAVPLAERAGAQAVTRDADGNIQVEHMPILGLAGQAYARAVKVGALAEADGNADRQDIGLRQQYRDNPDGYVAAAAAFKQKSVEQMNEVAGPEVATALGRSIDQKTTLTYRGLLNEKERLDLERADNSITAGINSASDDAIAMARGGAKPDDPAMQSALSKYSTLLQEKLNNPRLAYTKEQFDLDTASFNGQIAGARNLYHVDQVYQQQGYAAAMDSAKDILTNPDYKLNETQRQGFYSRSVGEIRANEAIRRQDVTEARTAFRELSVASQLGQRIEPDEVESVRQAFRSANYPAGVAMVDAAFAHKDLHDDFGRQPLGEQTQQLNAIKGAAAAKSAFQFFTDKGYSKEAAAGIVGNLVWESGLNPSVPGDQGTSGGLAQFHGDRLTALKQYAASQGKPWTDFQTQLQYIDRELNSNESVTRGLLRTATTPEDAAAIFAGGYERPKGTDYSGRQALARSVFSGRASDGSGGPGVQSWLIANRQATVKDAAATAWKQVMDDWSAGKGGGPSPARANEILDAARVSGNVDLQATIARDMDTIDKVQRISQLPVAQQAATELELRRRLANGSATPGADLIEKQLTAKTQAITEGLKQNPIATAVANFPDKFKTPPPLDFSSPDNLVAGIKMRSQIAGAEAANYQTGPLPILDRADVDQLTGALKGKDAPMVLGALSQGLGAEDMQAILKEKDFRDGVTGISRSGDPAKMNAAYSFMDTLQKQNPLEFDKQFPDGLKDLRSWQSNLSFYPPEEAAKRLMQAYDPAQSAAREATDKVVDKSLASVSPEKVVSKFSTGWGPIGTTAQTPIAPQAGLAAGALKADYDKNYRDGFEATGDPSAADNFAMEKLNLKYAVSGTNGNRVMPYAPERYYPQIDGSHGWMADQLDAEVAKQLGVKGAPDLTDALANTVEPTAALVDDRSPAERQYGARRAIVSDDMTERDIAAGRPPSYQVLIRDPNGRWGAMTSGAGAVQRFRFDPAAAAAPRDAAAEAKRVQIMQPYNQAVPGL
jgi:hypothetical protein